MIKIYFGKDTALNQAIQSRLDTRLTIKHFQVRI